MSDIDLTELCTRLAEGMVAYQLAIHKGLERCAVIVENSAKEEFGHLQPAVGPFNAWEELTDRTKDEKDLLAARGQLAVELNEDYSPLIRQGIMEDSIRHEVDFSEAIIGSIDKKMLFHELGTIHFPPRPVLGPALFKNKEKIRAILGTAVAVGLFSPHGVQKEIDSELGYNQEIK